MSFPTKNIPGIHHVTAITSDAQKNIDFYCGVLGLRLVKLTVNFDDPGSYHLYYGDELGRPGTIMTFFAWPGAYRGRVGPPQVTETAFSVPAGAIDYWSARLAKMGTDAPTVGERFGQPVLGFTDPDGMQLEIVGCTEPKQSFWAGGPVQAEHAIRGFHGVTIAEEGYEKTSKIMTDVMGFKLVTSEQNRFRYRAGSGDGFASTVDLLCMPDARHGNIGAGAVHHIAFRVADDEQQKAWHGEIIQAGLNVSPVMDRTYFHSIYFREPGGVLFELATDHPGFTADQAAGELGTQLMLPPWLEPHRAEIQRVVPQVRLPKTEPKIP
ncbi:MAG TPA: ring-cleaving dioxygenase [Tepidisphaeraceae bacterium]|nr:ring-cleaving dioxygenase [Tepidisphaeraceae bacterium]